MSWIRKTVYIILQRKKVRKKLQNSSVADPECLSRIPDPDFHPYRIPDLGSWISDLGSKNSNKREG
jgi:hypothetical protein